MAHSFIAFATASADEASSGSPCVIVRRSAWYTGLGRRACCTESLNTRLPNVSADPLADPLTSPTDQARIALIASPSTAEPMTSPPFTAANFERVLPWNRWNRDVRRTRGPRSRAWCSSDVKRALFADQTAFGKTPRGSFFDAQV